MKNLKIKKCGPFSVVSSRYKIGAEFGIVGRKGDKIMMLGTLARRLFRVTFVIGFASVVLMGRTALAQQQSASGELNKLTGAKDPIITDPSRAYPVVYDPPGAAFRPVRAGGTSVIEQLAHSSDGVVRLEPGDYSIAVRLY